MRTLTLLFVCWVSVFVPRLEAAANSVFLEDLTSSEVGAALAAGRTTIIIPVGGTEQNGPHMALGKHNVRVKALAGRIATVLGHALVAPVVAYVPEGRISPPTGHMRFAGTISVPDDAFEKTIEGAARSFKQHGFTDIVLMGDSGNYQPQLKAVAARLDREWATTRARAHFVPDYYRAAQGPYADALRANGLTQAQIGTHAGAADTSLSMAIDPALVRTDQMPLDPRAGLAAGVAGEPTAATAELGRLGVELIVARTVAAIRAAVAARR
jgi:creatinine amidohydrolase/Fe(II)-dependent formamide hydrolase-like protein